MLALCAAATVQRRAVKPCHPRKAAVTEDTALPTKRDNNLRLVPDADENVPMLIAIYRANGIDTYGIPNRRLFEKLGTECHCQP